MARLRLLNGINHVAANTWNALFPYGYPFVQHAFLAALENHGCTTPERGWQPVHALLEDDQNQPIAAAPLYLKSHSYGEFVFDFAWADASHQLGQPYYPKWLCAIPFSPVTGPRIGAVDPQARQSMANALLQLASDSRHSSLHALFLTEPDQVALSQAGALTRHDVQFHWHNADYSDFEAFLASLSSSKRKKIKRERRRINEAGLRSVWQHGEELSEAQWSEVYNLYANTYAERGQLPYLTLDFFLDYARAPGNPVRLVSVFDGDTRVAIAITLAGDDALYGRHWGTAIHYNGLHFETCYYQGIEYCIRNHLGRFDAGAQGAHKLARGFMPVMTSSTHWLADERLGAAVDRALRRERLLIDVHREELDHHTPYKQAIQQDERGDLDG